MNSENDAWLRTCQLAHRADAPTCNFSFPRPSEKVRFHLGPGHLCRGLVLGLKIQLIRDTREEISQVSFTHGLSSSFLKHQGAWRRKKKSSNWHGILKQKQGKNRKMETPCRGSKRAQLRVFCAKTPKSKSFPEVSFAPSKRNFSYQCNPICKGAKRISLRQPQRPFVKFPDRLQGMLTFMFSVSPRRFRSKHVLQHPDFSYHARHHRKPRKADGKYLRGVRKATRMLKPPPSPIQECLTKGSVCTQISDGKSCYGEPGLTKYCHHCYFQDINEKMRFTY